MEKFKSIDDALNFAIANEENAVKFYSKLAENAKNESMKDVFISFSKEEEGHKQKLLRIKSEKVTLKKESNISDLKLSESLHDVDVDENSTYDEILVVAMKREKQAYELYIKLSKLVDDADIAEVFKGLAIEESNHKLRFELEYDEYVLRDN